MVHLLPTSKVGAAELEWKKNIIGGKEVKELRGQEVGRVVHVDVKVSKRMTEIGMKKKESEPGAEVFNE